MHSKRTVFLLADTQSIPGSQRLTLVVLQRGILGVAVQVEFLE